MSLVTRSLPSLHGGVSQQSPLVRSPDQVESLTNGWPSIATGLAKGGLHHEDNLVVMRGDYNSAKKDTLIPALISFFGGKAANDDGSWTVTRIA